MSIHLTRRKLWRWGRWSQGGGPARYPRQSAFVNSNTGSRSTGSEVDPELLIIDRIVSQAERPVVIVLKFHHTHGGSVRDKALQLGIPKSTYHDRLEEGRWFVHTTLEGADKNVIHTGIVAVPAAQETPTPALSRAFAF